ncbi:MAG: hypothetical protein MI974_01555 [Chitinophagales bacterium]|nr:hypothetical protein [Chitinophagales bacterium]
MKIISSFLLVILFHIPALAQKHFYLETGSGIRVGTWQYNLGQNTAGDYAGKGLQYTHFSPYWPVFIQAGWVGNKLEAGLGFSHTLFFDNEMRIHQNPGIQRPNNYAFTEKEPISLIHCYANTRFTIIKRKKVRLAGSFSGGYFKPLSNYPAQESLNRSWFLEGGMSSLFDIGKYSFIFTPAYQLNLITGKNSQASHQLFSFGALFGIRKEW